MTGSRQLGSVVNDLRIAVTRQPRRWRRTSRAPRGRATTHLARAAAFQAIGSIIGRERFYDVMATLDFALRSKGIDGPNGSPSPSIN